MTTLSLQQLLNTCKFSRSYYYNYILELMNLEYNSANAQLYSNELKAMYVWVPNENDFKDVNSRLKVLRAVALADPRKRVVTVNTIISTQLGPDEKIQQNFCSNFSLLMDHTLPLSINTGELLGKHLTIALFLLIKDVLLTVG